MQGVTVVGKPQATVITSSPLFIRRSPNSEEVNAIKANKLAEEPELVNEQNLTPSQSANLFSKRCAHGPAVNQKSKEESTKFTNSSSPK